MLLGLDRFLLEGFSCSIYHNPLAPCCPLQNDLIVFNNKCLIHPYHTMAFSVKQIANHLDGVLLGKHWDDMAMKCFVANDP